MDVLILDNHFCVRVSITISTYNLLSWMSSWILFSACKDMFLLLKICFIALGNSDEVSTSDDNKQNTTNFGWNMIPISIAGCKWFRIQFHDMWVACSVSFHYFVSLLDRYFISWSAVTYFLPFLYPQLIEVLSISPSV